MQSRVHRVSVSSTDRHTNDTSRVTSARSPWKILAMRESAQAGRAITTKRGSPGFGPVDV